MLVPNVTRKIAGKRRKTPSPRRAPALAQWIGQLADDPGIWFLVWAPNRRAAREMVTRDIGAVARGSIKQVNGPGYFLFRASVKRTPSLPLAELQPPTGEYLILYDPPSEAWIVKRLSADARPMGRANGGGSLTRLKPSKGGEIPIRIDSDLA
jgi:hypothetical protein